MSDALMAESMNSVSYTHLLSVGDHVGGDIAAVELHALHYLGVGLGSFGLLDGCLLYTSRCV